MTEHASARAKPRAAARLPGGLRVTAASGCSGRAPSSPASAPGSRTWRCPGSSTPASATPSTWACAASPRRRRSSPSCCSAERRPTASTAGCILLSSQWFQMAMAAAAGGPLPRPGTSASPRSSSSPSPPGSMQSQSAPTYQAVITSLVPQEKIANAVALNSLQFNLSRAIGPVVAGLLLADAGAGWCFARERPLLRRRHRRPADDRVPAPSAGRGRASARASGPACGTSWATPRAARGHPPRRRRELPRLPPHHLPAGDRRRRAEDGSLRLQPPPHELRRRRHRGRDRHRPPRARARAAGAHAPRLRDVRRSSPSAPRSRAGSGCRWRSSSARASP